MIISRAKIVNLATLSNPFSYSSVVETYEYDYLGNRTAKTSNGVTTEYVTDLSSGYSQVLKAETDTGTVYYTRGFELISRREGTVASYYIYDGGLSVRALTSETGAVTDTLVFDAFGNETGRTGSSDNPYGFQGEEQDATGLYYLRARYMEPTTGTFTTMDTYGGSLTDPMSLHKYLFANSNPVMYCDPSGHSASLIETGAVIGIMSILSGSANAIIAEFIYKNNTDVSERSSEDLDKCALTAFLSGFTTCLFSCLATFFVCVFAFTVLECLMAAAICSLIAWMLGDIADYNHRNGNEDLAIGLDIAQQAFISAEITFIICGINGGGVRDYGPEPPRKQQVRENNYLKENGQIDWNKYAPNNGIVPGSEHTGTLEIGTLFDRYGERTGKYVGEYLTPYENKSLPYIEDDYFYEAYRVIKPIDGVSISEISPAFDQVGGGIQYKLPKSVQWYLDNGYIEVVSYWG